MLFQPHEIPPDPPGVVLRDPGDIGGRRKDIYDATAKAFGKSFPVSHGGLRMEVSDLHWADPEDYEPHVEKDKILNEGSLYRRLRGAVTLKDEASGAVLDSLPAHTLMKVPHLTSRGTFIDSGSDYTTMSQSRLQPGVYTRVKKNGTVETHVNSKMGGGPSFRVAMDQASSIFYMEKRGSKLRLYPILKGLGVSDKTMEEAWGLPVLQANQAKMDEKVLPKAYLSLVRGAKADDGTTLEEKIKALNAALSATQVRKSVTMRTLPNMFGPETAQGWKKSAAEQEKTPFAPDLKPQDLKDSYAMLIGRHGPLLAGMREWPKKWVSEEHNEGWLDWYANYSAGRRTKTDAWQIERWKSFKRRMGGLFKRKLSPRLAFSLMNWAIDPFKLAPRHHWEELLGDMLRYKEKMHGVHLKKANLRMTTENLRYVASLLNTMYDADIDLLLPEEELVEAVREGMASNDLDDGFISEELELSQKSASQLPMVDFTKKQPVDHYKHLSASPAFGQFRSYLTEAENPGKKGYDAKLNRWTSFPDPNRKQHVIGPGLLVPPGTVLPDAEVTNRFNTALQTKWQSARDYYNDIPGHGPGAFEKLPPHFQLTGTDRMYLNVKTWPKLAEAMRTSDWPNVYANTNSTFTDPRQPMVRQQMSQRQAQLNAYLKTFEAPPKALPPTAPR